MTTKPMTNHRRRALLAQRDKWLADGEMGRAKAKAINGAT